LAAIVMQRSVICWFMVKIKISVGGMKKVRKEKNVIH